MAFTDTPKIGVALKSPLKAAGLADGSELGKTHRLGSQIWGSDGRRYVYGRANATIAANTATVAVNGTTFLAAPTGGSWVSGPVAMATGDEGWFSVPFLAPAAP